MHNDNFQDLCFLKWAHGSLFPHEGIDTVPVAICGSLASVRGASSGGACPSIIKIVDENDNELGIDQPEGVSSPS